MDVLSHGRLNVGLSAGAPNHGALLGERLFDTDPDLVDFSHARVARLRRNLAGDWLGDDDTFVESAAGKVRPRVSPYAPGLTGRLWYGGGSRRSIEWAAKNGFNLLIGNLTTGEGRTVTSTPSSGNSSCTALTGAKPSLRVSRWGA